jgi:hypothetical protein
MALNRAIIHDINAGVDDLPLIEFALSELYNLRNENNMLTFKAYEDIGKIDGAVVKYVDNFYLTLSEDEKKLFYQILSALIAPSVENKKMYVRKTALLKDLQKTGVHRQLLGNLIDSHILISGKDENEEATVSIVHEILISSWKVIQDWIEQEKYFINANNHYENLSTYWIEHDKSKNDLLQGKVTLKEAEYFLFLWESNCSTNVRDFVLASVKKKERKLLPFVLLCLVGMCIGICMNFFNENIKIINIASGNNMLANLVVTILLIYGTWEKIKAAPRYKTINVSLIFWSAYFVLSIVVMDIVHFFVGLFVFPALVLLKLVTTIIKKIEIVQWKQRIFKREFVNLSVFQNFLQKTLKKYVWIIAVFLIVLLCRQFC